MNSECFMVFEKGSYLGVCSPTKFIFESSVFIVCMHNDKYVLYFKDMDYGIIINEEIKNIMVTCD